MKSGFFEIERSEKFEQFYCTCLYRTWFVSHLWPDHGIAEFEVMNL
jgi:hypothetical protein